MLGLRMDKLKNGSLCEYQVTEAFAEAVVQSVGRCSEFTAVHHAYDSLMTWLRQSSPQPLPMLQSGIADSRVRVVKGSYVGEHGTIVRTTASRVVVRLDEGGEVFLAPTSLCVASQDGGWVPVTPGMLSCGTASVWADEHELLLDDRTEVDDGYTDGWHQHSAPAEFT